MFGLLSPGLWVAWAIAVSWLSVAAGLWFTGAKVANAGLSPAERRSAVGLFRLLHLLSLLLLLSLAGWLTLSIWLWNWWPVSLSPVFGTLVLSLIGGVGVLAIATTRYRVMPGRRWLRLVENGGVFFMCAALAIYAVVGIRTAESSEIVWRFASGAALALALGFFLLSRAPARAALLLARQLATHGSQPRFEGTLKRLLRRHRPILIASAVAIVLGMTFSWRSAQLERSGGQLANEQTDHRDLAI
ncbi:MAG: hypothetical protein AAFN07_10690 [Pseudomonadota bacterium]